MINDRYVLTAAHCFEIKYISELATVRLGERDLRERIDCDVDKTQNRTTCSDEPIEVGIEEIIFHESRNHTTRANDIALLRLSRSIPTSDYIKPICLPKTYELQLPELTVAGWGSITRYGNTLSDYLIKVTLPPVNATQCNQAWSQVPSREYPRLTIMPKQICAGGQQGRDSCNGDSGGSLMDYVRDSNGRGRWTSVGVTSFGPFPCATEGYPAVHTSVPYYVPWIVEHLRP